MCCTSAEKSPEANIAIMGAGVSGLSVAVTAVEAGVKNIIVLETNKAPGGA